MTARKDHSALPCLRRLRVAASAVPLLLLLTVRAVEAAVPTPVLRYSFDEAASGNSPALDSGVAPQAHGSFVVAATRTNDTPGAASTASLDLTGNSASSNKVTTTSDVDKLDGLTAISITGWLKLGGQPTSGDLIIRDGPDFSSPANHGGFQMTINHPATGTLSASNFRLAFSTMQSQGSNVINLSSGSSASLDADDRWIFFAATREFDTARIYTGDETTPAALSSSFFSQYGLLPNTRPLYVGGEVYAGDMTGPLLLDDVRIYSSALTPAELEQVRQSNVPEPAGAVIATLALAHALLRRRSATAG